MIELNSVDELKLEHLEQAWLIEAIDIENGQRINVWDSKRLPSYKLQTQAADIVEVIYVLVRGEKGLDQLEQKIISLDYLGDRRLCRMKK